jgi:hypothetical protein
MAQNVFVNVFEESAQLAPIGAGSSIIPQMFELATATGSGTNTPGQTMSAFLSAGGFGNRRFIDLQVHEQAGRARVTIVSDNAALGVSVITDRYNLQDARFAGAGVNGGLEIRSFVEVGAGVPLSVPGGAILESSDLFTNDFVALSAASGVIAGGTLKAYLNNVNLGAPPGLGLPATPINNGLGAKPLLMALRIHRILERTKIWTVVSKS